MSRGPRSPAYGDASCVALVLLWSREEPWRIGEIAEIPNAGVATYTLGRAIAAGPQGESPLVFCKRRPGARQETGPLRAADISRRELGLSVDSDGALTLTPLGRSPVALNGAPVRGPARLQLGDLVECVGRFSLLVRARPEHWPSGDAADDFEYGMPDADGIVGESPTIWALRELIAFHARRDGHILVHGPSGAGKELIVRAIHGRSPRASAPIVSRNAVTIPETLVDAELFGNMSNYPNSGTPARPGLVGQANGSTLFLDEIGELTHGVQAHLLRVMDSGEYQRLGESKLRSSNVRIIGATNRELTRLKHDFLARFVHRVEVPGLNARPEDVVLIARHVINTISDSSIRGRFFDGDQPRFDAAFVHQLVQMRFTTHVRELTKLLWRSIRTSTGDSLSMVSLLEHAMEQGEAASPKVDRATGLTRAQVVAVMERVGGHREKAWRELGLTNRYQLRRLLKRLSLQ